jgi:hypothetical protein
VAPARRDGPIGSWMLNATGGPDTPLAGFVWTVPPGAIFDETDFQGNVQPRLPLAVLPQFPEGGNETVMPWVFLAYRLDGEAVRIGGRVERPAEGVVTENGQTREMDLGQAFGPTNFLLNAEDLAPGDQVGFVVGSTAPTTVPLAVHVKALDGLPTSSEPPTESLDEFVGDARVEPLQPHGTGSGLQYGIYYRQQIHGAVFGEILSEARGGELEVVDASPIPDAGQGSARDVTISASKDGGGHGEASGYFLTTIGASGGTYDISVSMHGQAVEARNLLAETPRFSIDGEEDPLGAPLGRPAFSLVGDGTDGLDYRFHVSYVQAGIASSLSVAYWSLGAVLEELLGVPAATGFTVSPSLAGDVPP